MPFRLDKNLFREGLLQLQNRVEERHYTTTLAFAHDLCEVINVGINTEPEPQPPAPPVIIDSVVAPVTKSDFSDHRDRKKLGKRILKMVQPQLEAALRLETEITHKSVEHLKQELEGMIEASLELRQNTALATTEGEASQDVIMVDASNEITVGEPSSEGATEESPADVDMGEAEGEKNPEEGNIEVNTSGLEEPEDAKAEDVSASGPSTTEHHDEVVSEKEAAPSHADGVKALDTPPSTNGYVAEPHPVQSGPPTPPQSNGSLGRDHANILADGGVPWYLKGFEPEGTSALQEQWPGKEAIRGLSEELTEMDEDELKGLEVDFSMEDGVDTPSANNVGNAAVTTITTTTAAAAATTAAAEPNILGSAKKPAKAKRRKTTTYRRR